MHRASTAPTSGGPSRVRGGTAHLVAVLLVLAGAVALGGCGARHHTTLPRSADPLLPPEHYLNAGDYAHAHRAALRRVESAQRLGDTEAIVAAELLLGEAMLGLNDHEGALPYLLRGESIGTPRQKSEASALLAYSHLRRLNDRLARAYFARVDRDRCDPRIWKRVCASLGRPAKPVTVPKTLHVVPRGEWARSAFRPDRANAMERIRRITVHHTGVVTEVGQSRGAAASRMRAIQRDHIARGWAGVGYHYVIDGSGRIWEARPVRYQGAHAGSHELNRGNVGVSLMGDFTRQHVSAVQRRSLENLLGWLMRRYGVAGHRVQGHGDLKHTQCPGAHLSHLLPAIVRAASTKPTSSTGSWASNRAARRTDPVVRPSIRYASARSGVGSTRKYHTVVRGDTLSRIARSYGVTVTDLKRLNPGASDLLFPGHVIAVP